MRKIVCATCGKEFEVNQAGRIIYCGEECRKQAKREQHAQYTNNLYKGTHKSWACQRESKQRELDSARARKENRKRLIAIDREAKKLGMSYGKYVAMMRVRGEKI